MKPKPLQTERSFSAPTSFLFTFRLWQTRDAQGTFTWRGKLQSVTTGEVRYLNGLQNVTLQLHELLLELEAESHLLEELHVP